MSNVGGHSIKTEGDNGRVLLHVEEEGTYGVIYLQGRTEKGLNDIATKNGPWERIQGAMNRYREVVIPHGLCGIFH